MFKSELRSKSLLLGAEANKMAASGDYYTAIDLFSKAIRMCPNDYRFYLNRAFCYEKIELYNRSLEDSEMAIKLNRAIEKCYLRKARAQVGLKDFMEAEKTYQMIFQMNPNSTEAIEDSIELRFRALNYMGFDKQNAIKGAKIYQTIRSAIDGLLSQSVQNCNQEIDSNFNQIQDYEDIEDMSFNSFFDRHIINTDNKDPDLGSKDSKLITNTQQLDNKEVIPSNESQAIVKTDDIGLDNVVTADKYADKARKWADVAAKTPPTLTPTKSKVKSKSEAKSVDKCEKPTNIWGYNGLRVEKVNSDNKKAIMEVFGAFGRVIGLEPVPNRRNAIWVYYDNPKSPIDAIASLLSTVQPNVNHYVKGQTEPLKVFFAATNEQKDLKFCRPKHPEDDGGECYYWRTTTCLMENCRLLHIPINKHIDAQVWMKDTEGKPI